MSLTADDMVDGAFGDRHHRPDPLGKLRDTPSFSNATVRLIVGDEAARSRTGQLGAWLAANLLARLDGLVAAIELVCPAVPVDAALNALQLPSSMARGAAEPGDLPSALRDLVERIAPGRAKVVHAPDHHDSIPVELIIGGQEVSGRVASQSVWCFGSGWRAFVGAHPKVATPHLQGFVNPLGMYLAICYGVGEVFKKLKGMRANENATIESLFVSLWAGTQADSWDTCEDGPSIDGVKLPAAYLIGAGAVGQALALAIATATAGSQFITVVDGQQIDRTNRNRYVLAFKDHENNAKAAHVVNFLRAAGITAHAEPMHWMPYASRIKPHPDAAQTAQEAQLRYPLILSCVDGNLARNELQSYWPRDLVGASTDGLRAQAAHYDLRTQTACLACHNPVRSFEHQVDHLRQGLHGLTPQDKSDRLLLLGFDLDDVEAVLEYLDRPRCGELGEQALKRFAQNGAPAFSVGFVSVGAGLLLARLWIRFALAGANATASEGRHYLSMNFLNGRFLWHEQGARRDCVCMSAGRAVWRQLWEHGSQASTLSG